MALLACGRPTTNPRGVGLFLNWLPNRIPHVGFKVVCEVLCPIGSLCAFMRIRGRSHMVYRGGDFLLHGMPLGTFCLNTKSIDEKRSSNRCNVFKVSCVEAIS